MNISRSVQSIAFVVDMMKINIPSLDTASTTTYKHMNAFALKKKSSTGQIYDSLKFFCVFPIALRCFVLFIIFSKSNYKIGWFQLNNFTWFINLQLCKLCILQYLSLETLTLLKLNFILIYKKKLSNWIIYWGGGWYLI